MYIIEQPKPQCEPQKGIGDLSTKLDYSKHHGPETTQKEIILQRKHGNKL